MSLAQPIDTLYFLFVTISSVIVLFLVGYSSVRFLEIVFRKKLITFADKIFNLSLDITLKLNFFLYLGISLVMLYVKTLLIFKSVNIFTLYGIFLFSLFIPILDVVKKKKKFKLESLRFSSKQLRALVVTLIFLIFFSIFKSTAIIGEYGSTEHDAAKHSILILNILNNDPESTTYPQGSHMMAAFLTTILNIPLHKIVTLLVCSFSVIIFLGFYSLTTSLLSKPLYGYLAGSIGSLFWLGGFYAVSWGGLPYMLGTYITLSSMAYSAKIIPLKANKFVEYVFFTSLFFVPLFMIYPTILLFEALWLALLLLVHTVSNRQNRKIAKTVGVLLLCLTIAVTLNADYLGTINLSPINDREPLERPAGIERNDMFNPLIFTQVSNFTKYTNLFGESFKLIPYGILICFLMFLFTYINKNMKSNFTKFLKNFSPTKEIMLLFYTFLAVVYLYIKYVDIFFLFPTYRVFLNIGIILVELETLSIIIFSILFSQIVYIILEKTKTSFLTKTNNINLTVIIAVTLLFMFSANLTEPMNIVLDNRLGSPDSHSVLTKNDVELQLWMKHNLSDNCTVLASPADAGQYVPIIAEKTTVIRYQPYELFKNSNYGKLLNTLSNSPSLATKNFTQFNITHIYIGAKNTLSAPVFNASLITRNIHTYELVYTVGEAYLFEVVYDN